MPKLSLTLACGPYAHTAALAADAVALEGTRPRQQLRRPTRISISAAITPR